MKRNWGQSVPSTMFYLVRCRNMRNPEREEGWIIIKSENAERSSNCVPRLLRFK